MPFVVQYPLPSACSLIQAFPITDVPRLLEDADACSRRALEIFDKINDTVTVLDGQSSRTRSFFASNFNPRPHS